MRDPEIIRRDIQIASLLADNTALRAERDIARAQAQAYELTETRDEYLKQRDGFVAELAAATRAANPPPAATPPSGRALVVEDPLAPPAR